jgi:serine phosphatase RsbU (regulator of sigma subunit)
MKLKTKLLFGFIVPVILLTCIIVYTILIFLNSHTIAASTVSEIDHFSPKELTDVAASVLNSFQARFMMTAVISALFAFIVIVVSCIIIFILSTKIMNSLYTVNTVMKEVVNKNFTVSLDIRSYDEFGDLARLVNGVVKEMKSLKKQLDSRTETRSDNRERFARDMEIAQRIQKSTCPPVPAHDELEIAATMSPARDVGGDYYDLLLDADKNLWIGIGDVSGNGIVPGLIVLMAQSAFNNYVLEKGKEATPRDAIVSINRTLTENIRIRLNQKYFMSMNFLKYTGSGKFLQAGSHLDILVYRKKTKSCDIYPTDGVYMGIIPDISSRTTDKTFHMDVHDILVVYTNGVIEAKNKNNIENLFGINALIDTVVANGERDASFIMEAIRVKALAWCGNQPVDDMTVVVVKRVK